MIRVKTILEQSKLDSFWKLLFILFLFIFSSCKSGEQLDLVFARRSILNERPRMITLRFAENYYLAYDLQEGLLRRFWKGGVFWNGTNYNSIKVMQPTSWGEDIWELDDAEGWKLKLGSRSEIPTVHYLGYVIEEGEITFEYDLEVEEQFIHITETPSLEILNGQIRLVRDFQWDAAQTGYELYIGSDQLSAERPQIIVDHEMLAQPEPPALKISGHTGKFWMEKSGCPTCHFENDKMIGPSYQDIADRYPKGDSTIQLLTQRIKNGTVGAWGQVPMIPHADLTLSDITTMVKYIMSLKKKENQLALGGQNKVDDTHLPEPGFGAPLTAMHPSYDLITIRPELFKPRVGGMDFTSNADLLICTWDSLGAVYRLQGVTTGDTNAIEIEMIAEGLAEPLGLKVVDDHIYVVQKNEITELIDLNGDGRIDQYRNVCDNFGVTNDFHEYTYGLAEKDNKLYATLGVAMRLMSHQRQHPDRGTAIRVDSDGSFSKIADGLRQPNGIGLGVDGELFVTENQGQWVPACKLIHLRDGDYHGCQFGTGDLFSNREMVPPAVWLPQDEIGNSPGQPVYISEGPYAGQMLHGEVTHGGIKRVFLEKIEGAYQGCVFRFAQGMEAGINRLVWGPDGKLYAGGVGMNGGWSHKEKRFGLQCIEYNGEDAFDMLKVEANSDGFEITFTTPIDENSINELKENVLIEQWYYQPTKNYGGPKLGYEKLKLAHLDISQDQKSVTLGVVGLKKKHVIHILLPRNLKSVDKKPLWSGETWYTLNNIPKKINS